MEQITAYILSLLEVIEKEGKLFKLSVARTLQALGWMSIGILFMGIGFLVLVWTCFTAISSLLGPALAGLAAAILILGGGGICLWIGKKNLK